MAYTYRLEWSIGDERFYYYGVKYAKNCCPSELGTTYFSSSKHVKDFIQIHGNPCVAEVDRVFEIPDDAVAYEAKVLAENNAAENPNWLNRTNGHKHFFATHETAVASGLSQRGKKLTDDHKDKIRKTTTATWSDPELRAAQSKRIKGRKDTPEAIKNKKAAQGSPEGRLRNRQANLGKRRTPEQIENYKAAAQKRKDDPAYLEKLGASISLAWSKKPIVQCPYCDMKGKKGRNMTIYHFDNCKHKNSYRIR